METSRHEADTPSTSNTHSQQNPLDLLALSQVQPRSQNTSPLESPASDEREKEKSFAAQATEWLSDRIFGCEPNPLFEESLWLAANALYDSSWRNDIYEGFQKGDACKMKTDNGAIVEANKVLDMTEDPYTVVLPKETTEQFNQHVEGTRESLGIGIQLVEKNNHHQAKSNIIGTVFPGSPADKAGLKPGDRILSANGESTTNSDEETIMGLLHGDEGTSVALKIDRDGKTFDARAERADVVEPATISKMVNGDTLYVRMFDFLNQKTDVELEKALKDNPNAKSILLDLRGNGGGRLDEMMETVSLVMDQGLLFKEKLRDMDRDKIVETSANLDEDSISIVGGHPIVNQVPRHANLTGDKPLVILTDKDTASAAELFTAALKDNNRGYVIGDTTFGKGVGQSTHELSNGAMLLVTSARYERPNGQWVGDGHFNKIGIKPDYTLYSSAPADQYAPTSKEDNQYQFALGWLKRAERTRGN